MSDLDTLNLHGNDVLRRWLGGMLTDNPNGLGSDLVEAITSPDAPATADRLLAALERLGWIERTMHAPSPEQCFFGVGGQTADRVVNRSAGDVSGYHGQCYMYRIVDPSAVEGWIGDKKPPTSTFAVGDKVRYADAFVAQIGGNARMRAARGTVVGFANLHTKGASLFPLVSWSDDPKTEPACASPTFDGLTTFNCGGRGATSCPNHANVAYAPSPISPLAVVKVRA